MVILSDIVDLVKALTAGLSVTVASEETKDLVSQVGSGDRILLKSGNTLSTNSYTKDRRVQYNLELDFADPDDRDILIDQIIEKIDEFKQSRVIIIETTYTIKEYTDDISRSAANETVILADIVSQVSNNLGALSTMYTMFRFKSDISIRQGLTVNSSTLRLTSNGGTNLTTAPDFRIHGYLGGSIPSPTDTLKAPWTANNTTDVFSDVNPAFADAWVAGTEYSLTTSDDESILELIQEMVDDAGFDGDIGLFMEYETGVGGSIAYEFFALNSSNSNPTKMPELDVNFNWTNEDVLDLELKSGPFSKVSDRYKGNIILEINQSAV